MKFLSIKTKNPEESVKHVQEIHAMRLLNSIFGY